MGLVLGRDFKSRGMETCSGAASDKGFDGASRGVRRRGMRISGLVVEYIAAIDVTRARFPADAAEYSEPA